MKKYYFLIPCCVFIILLFLVFKINKSKTFRYKITQKKPQSQIALKLRNVELGKTEEGNYIAVTQRVSSFDFRHIQMKSIYF